MADIRPDRLTTCQSERKSVVSRRPSVFVFDKAVGPDPPSLHTDRQTFCTIDNKTKALYMFLSLQFIQAKELLNRTRPILLVSCLKKFITASPLNEIVVFRTPLIIVLWCKQTFEISSVVIANNFLYGFFALYLLLLLHSVSNH
jgi:hypothetical protein